jgi:hypothetical protein
MRNFAFALAVVFLLASNSQAQSNQTPSPSAVAPLSEFALNAPEAPAPAAPVALLPSATSSPSAALPAAPVPAAPPQGVHGVYQTYSFEIYGGYTFMRFYEVPKLIQTDNGFNMGGVYYYHSGFVGAEGELAALFGSAFGKGSRLAFAGGGPRVRWSGPRGIELWGHGLIGGAHLSPRTAYGPEQAFGYEVGGGADINPNHHRFGYRVEADLMATRFFSTFQYSPKVSVGVVYKF